MGSPEGMGQTYDDLFHYALMRNFLTSGDYSILHCSMYSDINSVVSYYPAGLHIIVSSISSITNSSILVSNNAMLFVIVSIVWTTGWLFFVSSIFDISKKYIYVGSVITLLCVSFPWIFLTYGRITPNLLAFSFLPATISIFVKTFKVGITKRERIQNFYIVLLCAYSAIFTQPNFIFSCIILLYAFCIESIIRYKSEITIRERLRLPSACLSVLFSIFVLFVWILSYKSPFLSEVVHINWPSTTPLLGSLINGLTLCQGRDVTFQNFILGILIIVGVISIFKSKKNVWIVASYAIVLFVYVWTASFEGRLKHFVSGFWYTDQYRIMALLTISAIPLMISGTAFIFDAVLNKFNKTKEIRSYANSTICILVIAGLLLIPNISVFGYMSISSDIGYLRLRNNDWLTANKPATDVILNSKKMKFLDKVKSITKDDIVLNDPYDGSVIAFQYNGTKTVYRHLFHGLFTGNTINIDKSILEDGSYLDEHLNELNANNVVKESVKKNNVKYVLKLADNSGGYPDIGWMKIYDKETYNKIFNGIISLSDKTPGFKTILEEDNMRLYEIKY